ncbi:MAG TPA: AI-2E family transporter [Gaiellaceae bacterium]|jgi:predicted PurR-regulated permease PerM|nr:AI-2E family transporter [Gaiellaceae bacterium]
MAETARRAAVVTLVVGGIVVLALALWQLRIVVALLFLAFILAAAMRPTVEALRRRHVPRGAGIALHYVAFVALLVGFLWTVVPRAVDQIDEAVGGIPQTRASLDEEARASTGLKHDLLLGVQRRLEDLPSADSLVDPAVELTLTMFEVGLGIFFTLATAAYWIFERGRAMNLVCSLLPRPRRKKVRDTWDLIDAKLGAYVRGQMVLILAVGATLSLLFWALGLPYWLLLGAFAGVVELVPVIGPLLAGALAVGVGLTVSWEVALLAGLTVLVVRLVEDYLVIPRVLGDAVGLTPLVVLVSVTACAILFGGFAVILAIPAAAVLATLLDVIVRDKDPAAEEVPTVLFSAKDAETV